MVVMSDGEAFGWKLVSIISIICIIILLLIKPTEDDCFQKPEIIVDTVLVTDTIYQTDTVTVWKQSKPDTVYITQKDTI